jgi:hypothetical protein
MSVSVVKMSVIGLGVYLLEYAILPHVYSESNRDGPGVEG